MYFLRVGYIVVYDKVFVQVYYFGKNMVGKQVVVNGNLCSVKVILEQEVVYYYGVEYDIVMIGNEQMGIVFVQVFQVVGGDL